jgi:hypothetical protein
MPGLDTNVLVRWILDDDPGQAARVQQLFEEVSEQQLPLFVPSTVMLELEWVGTWHVQRSARNAGTRVSGRACTGASPQFVSAGLRGLCRLPACGAMWFCRPGSDVYFR